MILNFLIDIEPDEREWIIGHVCPSGIPTLVFDTTDKDVETAQTDCAAACDGNDDCKYAYLNARSWRQVCYNAEECGNWMDNPFWSYDLYIKP